MADKLTLPKGKFAHELTAGPVDPTMKAAEATTAKLYNVPVTAIKPIPGFNVRVESPDYIEHRDSIQASIAANGYNPAKPLSGYVATEEGGNVIYVTDGHTRLQAVLNHNADPDTPESAEIATLPVLVQPKAVSLADLTVQLHTANNGRPLTPFELGIVAKRLLADGEVKKGDLAKRLAITPRYLDDVLLLASADGDVKRHVASGTVSSTLAIGLLRKNADTAGDKIDEIVKKAAATGKKATKKLAGPKMKKISGGAEFDQGTDIKLLLKQIAGLIRENVETEDGEDEVKLTTIAGSITLVISVPAPEKPKAAPKPKKAAATKKVPAKKAAADDGDDAKPAKKAAPKAAAKKTAPKAPAKKAKVEDDIGIPGAISLADEDDEVVKLPPKVKSDEDIEEEADI